MTEKWMAYVAKEKCGCITAIVVDEPQFKKLLAKDLSDWIKQGRTVEHLDGETARGLFCICPKDGTQKWKNNACKDCIENK